MSELYKLLHFPTRLISTRARTHKTKWIYIYTHSAAAAARRNIFHFSDYIRFSSQQRRLTRALILQGSRLANIVRSLLETYERYEFAESNIWKVMAVPM